MAFAVVSGSARVAQVLSEDTSRRCDVAIGRLTDPIAIVVDEERVVEGGEVLEEIEEGLSPHATESYRVGADQLPQRDSDRPIASSIVTEVLVAGLGA